MRMLTNSEMKVVTGGQSYDCEALAAHIDYMLGLFYSYGCGDAVGNPSHPYYAACSSFAWEIQMMINEYNANC